MWICSRNRAIDLAQEAEELLMTMARLAFCDHISINQVEGRKQSRRTVPLIVVTLAFGNAGA